MTRCIFTSWMFLLVAALSFAGCSKETKPTAPAPPPPHPLVGTWKYEGNNFATAIAENVRVYLVDQGIPAATAAEFAAEVVDEFSDLGFPIITFRGDGTYTTAGPDPDAGTWKVEGGRLVLVDGDGVRQALNYTVAGNRLTTSITVLEFRAIAAAEGDPDLLTFFDVGFKGITVLTYTFTRQ